MVTGHFDGRCGAFTAMEVEVEDGVQRFVHNENIALYRRLIAESEGDPSRDEARHKMLLRLLGEEIAKVNKPSNGQTLAQLLSTVLTFATVVA